MKNIDLKELMGRVQETGSLVAGSFREKGLKHFARPLLAALIFVSASYLLVYAPAGKRLKVLNDRLAASEAASQYSERYTLVRDQLNGIYMEIPPLKAKDAWLMGALIDSLKAENIISDSIQPPSEEEALGLIYQRADMGATLKFMEFFSWLGRIEASKPVIHVDAVRITKKSDLIGLNSASCRISTIIPRARLTQ